MSETKNGHATTGGRREAAAQPRSWLQPFLLLALEQWQSHGYELIRRMSAFGFETLDRGSVYRTLRQLEKDGLVESGWDTSKDGPARRLYSLTDAGRAYLNTWAASLRSYQIMLNHFFTLYPSMPGADDEGDDGEDHQDPAPANGTSANGNGAAKANGTRNGNGTAKANGNGSAAKATTRATPRTRQKGTA